MAEAGRLFVKRSDYEDQINELQRLETELDGAIQKYGNLETKMDSFMEGDDANYEKTKAQVQQNKKMCQQAKAECEAAIQMLKEQLANMEEFLGSVGNMINQAAETGMAGLKTAVDIMNAIN